MTNLTSLQLHIWVWCKKTFDGIIAWDTDAERAYRFFEEAGELFQAMGMTKTDAVRVIDYVFERPIGDLSQEIGGVMVTLLALGAQQQVNVETCLLTEFHRIHKPSVRDKIRHKQISKQGREI